MHMSHAEKLRPYLADKRATWTDDAATWNDEAGTHLLLAIDGPLQAETVIDAHLRALAARAKLTLATTGEASPVARRTAARFGIELLDTTSLPSPEPAPTTPIEAAWADATAAFAPPGTGDPSPVPTIAEPTPPPSPLDFPYPTPGFFRALERPGPDLIEAADAFAALDALAVATGAGSPVLPPAEPTSPLAAITILPPGEGSPVETAAPGEGSPVVAPLAAPEPVVARSLPAVAASAPELVVAASEPEPVVAHEDPAMPWDLSQSAPEPEPVHVEASELAAMPWNLHTEQHEMLPAGRAATFAPQRPSALAQDWGLPWPRPVPATGGLAIADPGLWHAKERIEQVREDLNRAGAPSFGAVKPEGSSWLKRLSEFP